MHMNKVSAFLIFCALTTVSFLPSAHAGNPQYGETVFFDVEGMRGGKGVMGVCYDDSNTSEVGPVLPVFQSHVGYYSVHPSKCRPGPGKLTVGQNDSLSKTAVADRPDKNTGNSIELGSVTVPSDSAESAN